MSREVTWGVVQKLVVEADTRQSLVAALTIGMSYVLATHYTVVEGTLRIGNKGNPFLTHITNPEKLGDEVERWLASVEYPRPDYRGDGSVKKGWRVAMGQNNWDEFISITPVWIIYSK